MKKINILIKNEVDFNFRIMASKKYKFEKGWYSKSISEAMLLWTLFEKLELNSKVIINNKRTSCIHYLYYQYS